MIRIEYGSQVKNDPFLCTVELLFLSEVSLVADDGKDWSV